MTFANNTSSAERALRQRVEPVTQAFASYAQANPEALSPQNMLKLVHEFFVTQIELEMQNEELRRTQLELERERARYFDFYDLAPVGYITINKSGNILNANLTSAQQLGLARPALLDQTLDQFIHRDDQDRFYLTRQKVMATQTPQSCEFRLLLNESERWMQCDAVACVEDSGTPVLRLVLIDISERKQLEERLIRGEIKLRTILDGASDAILINDSQGNFQYANEQAAQMLGYTQDELLGMCVTDITPVADAALTRQRLAQLMTTGTLRYEPTLRRRDASTLSVELNARLLADGSGFAACRDITERKALQAAQVALALEAGMATSRQHLRELVALNEATREEERKHIAREVHDELGQVLTALRMSLSVLGMRYGEPESPLLTDVQRMKAMVDRAIAGVRNVATHLRPTALDMGLVPAIEWLCQQFAGASNLNCTLDAHGCLDLDEARAVVLFRIVQESLTNITRYARASVVHVMLSRRGNDLWLEVRDNGVGFDVDAARRKKSFGLLGMRERAINLGGCLEISSAAGCGTVLTLGIPFCPKADEAPP